MDNGSRVSKRGRGEAGVGGWWDQNQGVKEGGDGGFSHLIGPSVRQFRGSGQFPR